jgi:putative hydrolase of the HAD superfamily
MGRCPSRERTSGEGWVKTPMRQMILIVDVDGVIIRHPSSSGWSARIEEDLGVPRAALQALFFQRHWGDIVHGRAALRERLAPVLLEITPHVSCDQMIRYWFESDAHLDGALLAQLAEVRASGVALHLATVQEHERASYLWNALNLRAHFDDMHYSAQLGVSKPSQAFYEVVERRVGSPPSAMPSSTTTWRTSGLRECADGTQPSGRPDHSFTRSFQS